MPSGSKVLPVVCALIEREGRVLVAQRPAHKPLPLKWEFPGGKVERSEEPAAALVREIREELGCELTGLVPLPSSLHHYGPVAIQMLPFVAGLATGSAEPHPAEHVEIRWVEPERLHTLDLAAADFPVLENYRSYRGMASR
jgi:8-oxo-dGTP diphosphatase